MKERTNPNVFARRLYQSAGVTGIVLLLILSILPGDMQVRSAAPKELEHFAAYLLTAGALTLGFWSRRHVRCL